MKTPSKTTSPQREHLRHLERAFWIDHQIRAGRHPNATTIAAHFEITTKTAQRTLDFMRDRLKLPLGYSHELRGWIYTEPAYALPAVELMEGDLIAILLAEKLSRQYRGTAIAQQVEQAFAKVISALTETVSIDLAALAEAHSFEAAATSELNPDTFARLGRACRERRRLEMAYFTASRGALTRRRVDPLHLRNHLGDWYLIGWDHLRGKVLDFHAGRIRELTVLEEDFDWPAGFALESYLNSGFGMIRGSQPLTVELIFDEYQARWIRERGKFHPTEEREELLDGRLKLTMQVTALDGVKRFVMQYGAHVEVVQPEELRQAIREEVTAMQTIYNNSQPDQ
ncbi:MAG: WYL domain-containing protein [Acidobacteria bacterium]|nr:WYL domain-containing protein [Acidobacteriota bacterium]MBI3424170.1 WYL domain-containing protein [Acidobacteriota bacterium]